eukprot:TRINITY_DN18559_c0_g1_i1.p1 TRINITY_DN18559_c0_g1~~TRINITY_DN18559_c0_g1_i1.p1  ORF type:complete len:204 (+),score=42.04 TRINITY_DN18559_c0_g1_i1:29-640(+)
MYLRGKAGPYLKNIDLWIITIFDYFNVCILLMVIESLQWIGCWNMLSHWFWPWEDKAIWRDLLYIFIGIILRFIAKRFFSKSHDFKKEWELSPPPSFQWGRKLKKFASSFVNFLAFLFGWCGLWDLFDVQVSDSSFIRDFMFFIVPLLLGMNSEVFLSEESLYYFVARLRSHGFKAPQIELEINTTRSAPDTDDVVLEVEEAV